MEDRNTIGETTSDYFKDLFGSFPETSDLVLEDNNRSLSAIPEEEEIKRAISGMNASSAPGPDGFTGKFYLSCWDIVKEDLTAAIGCSFKGGLGIKPLLDVKNVVLSKLAWRFMLNFSLRKRMRVTALKTGPKARPYGLPSSPLSNNSGVKAAGLLATAT
ncbi:hypothetical protein QQ045_026216 [Rhodiola kirilowii]